ncbi:MAG: FAD-dependent oxidoreductase [Candidatus Kapabacteria bacterium]|nr:FAD-dependent oxidoreductase [Candidatus Kapabacteria bacterium]
MDTHTGKHAIVIGAGVIGLSTARALLSAGFSVRIIADTPTQSTTSMIAPAMWHPYKVSPDERMREWAHSSFAAYKELAENPATGVTKNEIREYYGTPALEPWYASAFDVFRRLDADELPEGYADGFSMESFVIDTTVYMQWLETSLINDGVSFERRTLESFEELLYTDAVVVNCTGLGARLLAGDESVYPIRGQVVRVRSGYSAGNACVIDENGPRAVMYAVPRSGDVLLGGTADEHVWNTTPDDATTADIVRKAQELVPALGDATVIESLVGLRPARPAIRLERDALFPWLIHNYGHSGAGFTLAWGCAAEAVRLVKNMNLIGSSEPRTV